MRFFFTEEDHLTRVRGSEIRAALVHARHFVVRGRVGDAPPPDTDVWMYGLGVDGAPPLADSIVQQLLESSAQIVLFQLCDAASMSFERIPERLAARTRLVLRNHWPTDPAKIPGAYRDRIGWLPPMLKTMAPNAGKPLAERAGGAIFFGSRTGFSNLSENRNAREETVRIMRASGLPFRGGLLPHRESRYHTEPELLVPKMSERKHTRQLRDSKLCLAPWGNHPLTYRLFEGLALRCLVIAQPISDSRILDGGLTSGQHYVEVAADLSNLTEVVKYYLEHLDEAQQIADAGHEHFTRYLASRGPLISKWIFDAAVASWGALYRPGDAQGLFPALRAAAAGLWPRKF
ncbi:MAG TPA: glycosyltransferase [Polyangiaceae bacterium]|nr:glycosyltransferase [Polyangiaceae bacterium]